MAKFYDENGNEVEAYTEDELKAKNQEAIEEYVKQNPDKSGELTNATKALEEAQNKLKEYEEAGGGNDAQKKRLVQQKKDAETALETLKADFTKQINEMKEGFISGSKMKILDKLSKGDPELKKKIEFEYDQYSEGKPAPANEIEVQQRLEKAFLLATGNKPAPNFMDNMGSGGTKGNGSGEGTGGGTAQETENGKAMRKAFGISDEDAKKYAPEAQS
jgi:hypothetical protein